MYRQYEFDEMLNFNIAIGILILKLNLVGRFGSIKYLYGIWNLKYNRSSFVAIFAKTNFSEIKKKNSLYIYI